MSASDSIRLLVPGDEEALERFLVRHAATSMFLRSNVRAAGLEDHGGRLEGTYVATHEGDDVTGVAAHFWNGMVHTQAPDGPEALACEAVRLSGRDVKGFLGPWGQAVAARHALGLDDAPAQLVDRSDLFTLDLADLRVPAPLADGHVRGRHAEDRDRASLAQWLAQSHVEILGGTASPELDAQCHERAGEMIARRRIWVLEGGDGRPLCCTGFNAVLPDTVQIGAVHTPPENRCRGYARSAVAASLLDARDGGVRTALLFTAKDNTPAQRAYLALGFRVVGEFALILLRDA